MGAGVPAEIVSHGGDGPAHSLNGLSGRLPRGYDARDDISHPALKEV